MGGIEGDSALSAFNPYSSASASATATPTTLTQVCPILRALTAVILAALCFASFPVHTTAAVNTEEDAEYIFGGAGNFYAGNSASPTASFLRSGFNKSNPHAVEQLLVYAESERAKGVFALARRHGFEVQGFYHTSNIRRYWREIITEQLALLDGKRKVPADYLQANTSYQWDSRRWTSLLHESDGLYLNVAGTEKEMQDMVALVDEQQLQSRAKITFNFNHTMLRRTYEQSKPEEQARMDAQPHLSEGEYSTIDALHNYCKGVQARGGKALVYYIHNKGSCCPRVEGGAKNAVAGWRELMNTYVLEFPSICVRALVGKGYSTCGANSKEAEYGGNFWWTTCQHVAALPRLWTRFDAWAAEDYVHNVSSYFHQSKRWSHRCGYSTHNCQDPYNQECQRKEYRGKLYEAVMTRLPPSGVTPPDNSTRICRQLVRSSYPGQAAIIARNFK
ncbi:hypothetical protein B484DRAFT_447863 [Ochromonadaceae sp. CCMP2298]|nr:hypothetical protein B484DRAFT_447863 [Ochromonadaceae sp. CCMP2298]|mmetsp:Transcript_30525/g.65760  ORF Transcript_30525/g.65760 Transcript_30525/m.65760 type:complete len:448 (+) Transcript_30525:59-1402(+)